MSPISSQRSGSTEIGSPDRPRIVTLTFEPAVDMTTSTPRVVPTDKLRCTKPVRDPGGGGINVARVVAELGGEAVAVFPAGGPTGELLIEMLADTGIECRAIPMREGTRRNITVDAEDTGEQYRFVMPAPVLSRAEASALVEATAQAFEPDGWFVLSGGVPKMHRDLLPSLFARAREMGVRIVADTSASALDAIAGAWLMKPNLLELESIAGHALTDREAVAAAARGLITRGHAEAIVVSLAERGALLVTAEEVHAVAAPAVRESSAVGAGDSMVAGIVLASARGASLVEAVRLGVLTGAAALLTPATRLVRRADVERLMREQGLA